MLMLKNAIIILLFILAAPLATAQTEAECKRRVITAMENAKGLGGSPGDEERWGRIAAADCMKGLNKNDLSADTPAMSEGLRFLLIVVGLAAMYWFIWRPDINGWKIPFVKTKAEKAEAIFNATADEIKRSLGSLSKEDISKMSLEEICKVTGAVETHVRVELRQRMWNCADYDAVATRKRLDSIRERTNQ